MLHDHVQVRCYMGDNEQRWYMWYSGSSAPLAGLAGVAPAAGSIGEAQFAATAMWLQAQHVTSVFTSGSSVCIELQHPWQALQKWHQQQEASVRFNPASTASYLSL
jgi:hypothetical protein